MVVIGEISMRQGCHARGAGLRLSRLIDTNYLYL